MRRTGSSRPNPSLKFGSRKEPVFCLVRNVSDLLLVGFSARNCAEGDKQTPEGFYYLTEHLLHQRRPLPVSISAISNAFDRTQGRNGSLILIHGGCDSIGCLAMTNSNT